MVKLHGTDVRVEVVGGVCGLRRLRLHEAIPIAQMYAVAHVQKIYGFTNERR